MKTISPKLHRCAWLVLLLLAAPLLAQAQQTTTRPRPAARARPPRAPAREEAAAPALPAEAVQVKLPAPVTAVAVGNSGKYLFLNLPKLQQIAVFDVAQSKVIKYIATPTADILMAAGADKLFVGLVDLRQIQRWDLKQLKLDWTKPEPEGQLSGMAMGAASTGPLVIAGGKRFWVINADTFEAVHFPSKNWGSDGAAWGPSYICASFDGSTIMGAGGGWAGIELGTVVGGNVTNVTAGGFVMGDVAISGDGQIVFRDKDKPLHSDLSSEITNVETPAFPADNAAFSLSFHKQDKDASLAIFCNSDPRPLITLNTFPELAVDSKLPLSQRVHLVPQFKALVTVGVAGDNLIVRPFDLEKELAASGQDYLFVESAPVGSAAVGKPYLYQLKIDSKSSGVKAELQAGPPGMTVSDDGKVQWNVPAGFADPSVGIIIQITNASGQTVFHNFNLRMVSQDGAAVAVVKTNDPAPGRRGGSRGAAAPPANASKAGGSAAAPATQVPAVTAITAESNRIQLPAAEYKYVQGTQGHALLLCGNQLVVLAPDGFTIKDTHTLPKKYIALAERKDYYVALCQDPRCIDVLNKSTLAVIRTRPIAFNNLNDVVLHPTRPLAYVSYTQLTQMPSHFFLIFDELTGEAQIDDQWLGQWLQMSPDGRFLLIGFKEIYQNGNDIIDNPDRTWIVPSYGSLDVLARYDLDADGVPIRVAHKEGVGGNGFGIRLSADGKVASYLSFVGYPEFSKNLAGWNPLDLHKLPITYPTKDVATPTELQFHPLLPFAASPGKGNVVFFNRGTGEKEDDRIDTKTLPAEPIEKIYFSPDGKNLLLDIPIQTVHFLYHLPLKLSTAEAAGVKALPRPDKPLDSSDTHAPKPSGPHKLPEA